MGNLQSLVPYAPALGAISLLFAVYLAGRVNKADPGTKEMVKISGYISDGAMTFLRKQYSAIAAFVVVVFLILGLLLPDNAWQTAICFLVGALCSAGAGFIGMKVATKANVRTTQAARTSQNSALGIAFSGGAVMGMSVTGLGLLGLGILYIIFRDPTIVNGFAMGGSSIALFGRVIKGQGNNGDDLSEGACYKNAFGTYLHGPILAKNPHLADLLLTRAVLRQGGEKLTPLNNELELFAHNGIKNRLIGS